MEIMRLVQFHSCNHFSVSVAANRHDKEPQQGLSIRLTGHRVLDVNFACVSVLIVGI